MRRRRAQASRQGLAAPQTRTPRRKRERDARVDWILDAALEIVASHGISSLTTPRLAKELGYTPAAFYRYFSSKDDLLLALETRTAARFYTEFFDALSVSRAKSSRLSPRASSLRDIVLLARTYKHLARLRPTEFRLVGMLVTGDRTWWKGPGVTKLLSLVLPRVAEVIGYFAAAERTGALSSGDASKRAMTAWLSIHAVLAADRLAAMHPDLFDLDALLDELLSTLLLGWKAKPVEVRVALADQ